jgi:acyl-CoA hydrolase
MPNHTNQHGTAFGGTILSWIDVAAAMVAERHSNEQSVTVSMDKIEFRVPINIGNHVLVKAKLLSVGTSSMDIEVIVIKENPNTNDIAIATTARVKFVALNKNGNPTQVPSLDLE